MQENSWPTWLKSAIASGLVVALVTPLVESSLSYVGVSFDWLTSVSDLILNFLTYRVTVWQMLVGIATLIGTLAVWTTLSPPASPDWRNYTSDRIKGVDWKWRWNGRKVLNLMPFCPECSTQLKVESQPSFPVSGDTRRYQCPNCDFGGRWPIEIINDVKLIIERNARKGDYKT